MQSQFDKCKKDFKTIINALPPELLTSHQDQYLEIVAPEKASKICTSAVIIDKYEDTSLKSEADASHSLIMCDKR